MSPDPFKPPPTSSTKPKPPQPKKPQVNHIESFQDELKKAGREIAAIPGEMIQEAADQMWAGILGVEPPKRKPEGEKEPDSFTKLNLEKLNNAYTKGDMLSVEKIQERLQEHQQEVAENQVRHRQFKQEEEKAIAQMQQQEEQKKKEELEEEQMKKQEEEQEQLMQQQSMAGSGAGKAKGGLGQPRKKASTDQNVFETGRKKG